MVDRFTLGKFVMGILNSCHEPFVQTRFMLLFVPLGPSSSTLTVFVAFIQKHSVPFENVRISAY